MDVWAKLSTVGDSRYGYALNLLSRPTPQAFAPPNTATLSLSCPKPSFLTPEASFLLSSEAGRNRPWLRVLNTQVIPTKATSPRISEWTCFMTLWRLTQQVKRMDNWSLKDETRSLLLRFGEMSLFVIRYTAFTCVCAFCVSIWWVKREASPEMSRCLDKVVMPES